MIRWFYINCVITYITASTSPDSTWIGQYILFPIDVVLFRFINKFAVMGSNTHGLTIESSDTAEIQKELKIRFTLESPSLSNVKAIINLETYREQTI